MSRVRLLMGLMIGLVAVVSPSPAGATTPLPSVGPVTISGGADVSLLGSPTVTWAPEFGATYDIEIARARDRDAALGGWVPEVTDGAADGKVVTTNGRGRVLCVRVRYHSPTDDAPWSEDCAVRPHDESAFAVTGAHVRVRTAGSRGHGTRLLDGGALRVPRLSAGDRVAAIYAAGRWSDLDRARWQRPDGTEGRVAQGFVDERTLTYGIAAPGTGSFFSSPGLGTAPITGVAVIPGWFPPGSTSYLPHVRTRLDNSDSPVPSATYSLVTPNGSTQFEWNASPWSNVRPQLQLATGPALGQRPAWKDRQVTQYAAAVRVRVPQGSVTCARLRWRRTDGVTSAWSRAWCATRPFDDARAPYRGGFRAAPDPASADGRSRRMAHGAAYRIADLRRGSLFGFLYYDEPTRPSGRVVIWPGIGLDGRAPATQTGFADPAPTPSAWWVRVRRTGTVGTVVMPRDVGNPVVRLSGILVIPRWAR
jgi:hypothetical protein